MGTCGSVAGRGERHGRLRVVPKLPSAQQPAADGKATVAAGTVAADGENDDAASSADAEDSGSDSEQSEGGSQGDDDPTAQSLFGPVPAKRRRRGRHRRNKSRHAHKKAQRQLEERMRTLKTDDLTEPPDQADVIHSPVAAGAAGRQQQADSVDITLSNSASPSSQLQLPAASQLRPAARCSPPGASSHAAASHPGGLFPFDPEEVSILLIDGDAEVMSSIEEWLASCRYSVIACDEGREAIEVLLAAGAREDSGRPAGRQQQQRDSVSSSSSSSASHSPASSSSAQPSAGDVCDIDMIVCDWSVSVGSQTFLDWVMDNPSLSHIPVIILCDDETTAQGMDRLLRRGAADIIRKPLLRHPFLHSLQTIINNKVEQQHAQLLKTRGDEYKQELNRGKTGSLLSLPAPKRSLSSMLHTFVAASPRHAVGAAAGSSALSPRQSQLAAGGLQQVHAVLVSADEGVHADVAAAVSSLPLTLHSCCSPRESLLLQEDIDAQSNTSSIIAQSGASASELLSPHFPSHFAFSASTLSSPTSRTAAGFQHSSRSARVSIAEEQQQQQPASAAHPQQLLISPLVKKSSGVGSLAAVPNSFRAAGGAAQPPSASPRLSGSMRPSIIGLQPVSSYFGTELFILDAAVMRGEEGREWMEIMKARSAKQQTPVLLLTPESDPSSQLVRELHPLSVSTISLPLSSSLLSKKLHLILDSVSIIRHQRLYAYRAQAYRALVKKMRESKDRERERTAAGGAAGSLRLGAHASHHSEDGSGMPQRQSVSASFADSSRGATGQSEEEAMRSLLSSPTGVLMRPSSRRPEGFQQDGSVPYLASRKASEVILQPFTSFPPPGFNSRRPSLSVSGRVMSAHTSHSASSHDDGNPENDLSPPTVISRLGNSGGTGSNATLLTPSSPPGCLPSSLSARHDESERLSCRLPARDSPPLATLERTLDTLVGLARVKPSA